jgi:mannose-6-phosphate isomerase-like protein (cupin superfamily)
MGQRRVVTETVGGRSRVRSDAESTRLTFGTMWIDEVWTNSVDQPLGYEPSMADSALAPPKGALHWRFFCLPPDESGQAHSNETTPEGLDVADEEGWHKTETLDYVFVLDGGVTLVLDDAEVDLDPGDCVIQRATRHAWRNRGNAPVRLLAIMLGVE